MTGSPPNFHKMDSRSACIQDVLKVIHVKGHVIRALSWILGMSYSVIDGLVQFLYINVLNYRYFHTDSSTFLKIKKKRWKNKKNVKSAFL